MELAFKLLVRKRSLTKTISQKKKKKKDKMVLFGKENPFKIEDTGL